MNARYFLIVIYLTVTYGADIKLCEEKYLKGECTVISLNSNQKCVNLEKKNWASSLNIKFNCFRLYEKDNCEGRSLYVSKKSPGHKDLALIGMNKMISSVGNCLSVDVCSPYRRAKNNGNCPFIIDYLTIGPLPELPKDTANLTSPVVFYQSGGSRNRTEVMQAVIEEKDLNTGTDIDIENKNYVHKIRGSKEEKAGYILPKRLGGSGSDRRNIYLQNKEVNNDIWKKIEEQVIDAVKKYGRVRYTINLHYDKYSDVEPDFLVYRILGGNEDRFIDQGDVINQKEKFRR